MRGLTCNGVLATLLARWLVVFAISSAGSPLCAEIIVEEVAPGSAEERAGMRPGQVVSGWERLPDPPINMDSPRGVLSSVSDWDYLKCEQAPRGVVVITGEESGQAVELLVSRGEWKAKVRPALTGAALGDYLSGRAALESDDLDRCAQSWTVLAEGAESDGNYLLASWVYLELGRVYTSRRCWAEAEWSLGLARKLAKTGDDTAAESLVLEGIGRTYEAEQRFGDAAQAYRAAIGLQEALWGQGLGVGRLLNALGQVLRNEGNMKLARIAYQRALEIHEKIAPGSVEHARSLNHSGAMAFAMGDVASAEDRWARARAIQEKVLPDSIELARTTLNLGHVAKVRGDFAAARASYQRALGIAEEAEAGSLMVAYCLMGLGVLANESGDFPAADGYYRRAFAIKERLVPNSMDLAGTLNNMGVNAADLGDYPEAEGDHRQALAIRERIAPGSPDVAESLLNVAWVAFERGELAVADQYFRRALDLIERTAPQSSEMAGALYGLGAAASERGDLTAAETYWKRSLRIFERIEPEGLSTAGLSSNLGEIEARRGRWPQARDLLSRAVQLQEKAAPESPDVATSLHNLGVLSMDANKLDMAKDYLDRSLAISQGIAPEGLASASSMYCLGRIAVVKGDLKTAESHWQHALGIQDRLAPRTLDHAKTLGALGHLYQQKNDPAAASDYFARSIEALESQVGKLGGTRESQAAYGAENVGIYASYVEHLLQRGQAQDAFHVMERMRARMLLAMMTERDILYSDVPGDLSRAHRRIAHEYDEVQTSLQSLSPQKDASKIEVLVNRMQELRLQRDEVAVRMREKCPRLASLQYPRPLTLDQVQHCLDSGTVLLSYWISEKTAYVFAVGGVGNQRDPVTGNSERFALFALPKNSSELRKLASDFREAMVQVQKGNADQTSVHRLGMTLYDALVKPAESMIEPSTRVLICPDGFLHSLPFNALIRSTGSGTGRRWQYFVEWKPVHSVVSATVYAELQEGRWTEKKDEASLLVAFGDPEYPPKSSGAAGIGVNPEVESLSSRGLNLNPLPASRHEVEQIASVFPGKADVYIGKDATEERAKSLGSGHRFIHFACHGIYDEKSPLDSALALSMLPKATDGGDNGLLQAWEIMESVRIDADLVVLSACKSGLGKEMGGEGLVGLTRAFQYAGARTVLASLWDVPDRSTAMLMTRFYEGLKSGLPKDEALRRAQLALINSPAGFVSHPYHWAAFQLVGDWK